MDNINEFEDFDVEVVETSKTSIEEVQEEVVETSEIEESCECENNNCADSTECTEEVVDEAVPSERSYVHFPDQMGCQKVYQRCCQWHSSEN